MLESAPTARALTESAVLDLYNVLNKALCPDEFFALADAVVSRVDNQLPLPLDLGTPDILTVEGNRGVDKDNARLVHEYLGEMDRANAADARLWCYLSFATYRQYMEERWPVDAEGPWKNRIKDRWLLHTGGVTRGKLVRHGIARLWWVAHLTFEAQIAGGIVKSDGYTYAREVFKNEDRLNAIFDRAVGANPNVIRAVLDHAVSMGDKATDKYLQRIMQYLTLVNGYRDVGRLDFSACRELVVGAAARAGN